MSDLRWGEDHAKNNLDGWDWFVGELQLKRIWKTITKFPNYDSVTPTDEMFSRVTTNMKVKCDKANRSGYGRCSIDEDQTTNSHLQQDNRYSPGFM